MEKDQNNGPSFLWPVSHFASDFVRTRPDLHNALKTVSLLKSILGDPPRFISLNTPCHILRTGFCKQRVFKSSIAPSFVEETLLVLMGSADSVEAEKNQKTYFYILVIFIYIILLLSISFGILYSLCLLKTCAK